MKPWIPVEERLPEKHVWIEVFEDDETNPRDVFFVKHIDSLRKTRRITPARLLGTDREGFPVWYLCYGGSHPIYHVRNVTHWREIQQNFPEGEISC